MEFSIRDWVPTVAVVCIFGVALTVLQQGGELPPVPVANYLAGPAVSGVTASTAQQVVVTNAITGQSHVGDLPRTW
jgi:hypothetical protein